MESQAEQRVRYRTVLANREFAALFTGQVLSLLGDQLARIALAIMIYERTGSALASSATYAVSYLTYLVGGPLLSSLADRYPRLTVMVVCDLLRAPLVLLLCITTLPLGLVFVLIGVLSLLAPPFDSARASLQPDLLVGESYVVGNALITMAVQAANVVGFVLGGALVATTSVRGALALDAATFLVSAGLLVAGIRPRGAAQAPADRRGFVQDSLDGLRLVLHRADMRRLLVLAILGSVAVTSTEGVAVAVAASLDRGAFAAGVLTATSPAGFLLGSMWVLRQPPQRREVLLPRLLLLSCLPLLLTPVAPDVTTIAVLWIVAGAGATINLIAAPKFIQLCPPEFRGRAVALAGTCLQAAQGVGLLAAGVVAQLVSPQAAVAVVAAVTLLAAVPMLVSQGNRSTSRNDLE